MKTTFKILRSIITSFLFIILTIAIIVQFAFTTIRLGDKSIPDLIDREVLLKIIIPESDSFDNEDKSLALDYIDQYINYVFHKRSYPSIQSMDYGNLSEEEIKAQEKFLKEIRSKIDLKYENVLMLRNINNFLSNGSIYLLINIGVLVIVLLILIFSSSVTKTLILSSVSLALSGLIILISSSIILSQLPNLMDSLLYNFVKDIFDDAFRNRIFNQSLVYFGVGFILFLIFFTVSKLLIKKQSQN